MKIATAPVNWNNADAPDFREWFPYPQILDLMVLQEWRNLTSGVDQIGKRLCVEDVNMVFHNHVGTYVETEAETARLLEETNPDHVG